ncbi:MAG: flagellar type III secretion system protein FliR, partial [Firmicutes bacterium HGW-Firmicutes-13]
ASVFDPQFGSPVTLMGQFYYFLGLVYFFIINGHHSLLAAFAASFRIIPTGLQTLGELTLWKVMELFFWMFILSFQIALPLVVTLLLMDISLGLISKTVPQLQVFMVGLPLKIGVGMAVVIFILPLLGGVFENIFSRMITDMFNLMRTF